MMDRDEIISTLRDVPDRVEGVCRGLSDERLRRRPEDAEWSILELCCHLRDSAAEEGLRVRRLVQEDNPTLVPYDQGARAIERNYQGDDPRKVLTAMRAFWSGLAYQLERLSDGEWARRGVHPESGPVTVRGRAELSVQHAREHLEQMQAVRQAIDGRS